MGRIKAKKIKVTPPKLDLAKILPPEAPKLPKVALVAITKDSKDDLLRMVSSVLGTPGVEIGVFITDTGSTDGTPDTVRKLGWHIYETKDRFWKTVTDEDVAWAKEFIGPEIHIKAGEKVLDFAAARNFSFEVVPDDYDWILWLDSDDVLRHRERLAGCIAAADGAGSPDGQKSDVVFVNYLYHVEILPDGNIGKIYIQHIRERLFRNNHSIKWVGMIHETPVPNTPNVSKLDIPDGFEVLHLGISKEKRVASVERNTHYLELEVTNLKGKDPRPIMYLARDYYDLHKPVYYEYAKKLFKLYLEGDAEGKYASGWPEERATAWEYLGNISLLQNNTEEGIFNYFKSFDEAPSFPGAMLGLAMAYSRKGQHDKAIFWAETAIKSPIPKSTLVSSPTDYRMKYLEVVIAAAMAKDPPDIDTAYTAINEMASVIDHPEVQEKLNYLTQAKMIKEYRRHLGALADFYAMNKIPNYAALLLQAVPPMLQSDPVVVEIRKKYTPPTVWGENSVAIYCGPGFQPWSPKTLKEKGIGGSEEAVIYLSKELVKLGWKVTVFADPQEDAGVYDGVEFKNYYEANFNDTFNILIAWRMPQLMDLPIKAKKIYLDVHDDPLPMLGDYKPERWMKFQKMMVKSQFQRARLPEIPDDKFAIIPNGLEIPEFKARPKVPHKVFYGSSYDRGLFYLLKMWPKVLEAVPDATLEVCYGWDLFDKIQAGNPERAMWKERMQELLSQKGITHHGRVGHPELEEIISECSVWAYPTDFDEISCITAMRAQVLRAWPVVISRAALKETVIWGDKVEGDISDPETQEKFRGELTYYLKTESSQLRDTVASPNFWEWSIIAKQWDDEFRSPAKLLEPPNMEIVDEILRKKNG